MYVNHLPQFFFLEGGRHYLKYCYHISPLYCITNENYLSVLSIRIVIVLDLQNIGKKNCLSIILDIPGQEL